jgi:release factor glutamine methyltransferase
MIKGKVSIAELLRFASTLEVVSDTPRIDLEVLLCHALDKPRSYLYTWPEKILAADVVEVFVRLLQDRQSGVPIAHLTGRKEFWSLDLEVNAQTLIPRPETELLVETALELIDKPEARVLDLGTGTGAIALALASERAEWNIIAVDIVQEAVDLADKNRQRLGFANVSLLQSDWFENLSGQSFDVIVANPPYIDRGDEHLNQGDVRFEPVTALVAGNSGLSDIEKIVTGARAHLGPGAYLLIEHGYQQGGAVRTLLAAADFTDVATKVDSNGLERLSLGRLSG